MESLTDDHEMVDREVVDYEMVDNSRSAFLAGAGAPVPSLSRHRSHDMSPGSFLSHRLTRALKISIFSRCGSRSGGCSGAILTLVEIRREAAPLCFAPS